MPRKMERITVKNNGPVRRETLEGVEHIVVPMIMITEGVHNGSGGAIMYSGQELGKWPAAWNHKPVVVYHPDDGSGNFASACDVSVLNTAKVGVILNAAYTDGKLKAEAWCREDQIERVDKRILTAIENEQMMELSTGLFCEGLAVENGKFGDTEYNTEAVNIMPDHLAILPDQEGACNNDAGAGFLRVNQAIQQVGYKNAGKIMQTINEQLEKLGLVDNGMSDDNKRSALRTQLHAVYAETDYYPYLVDVYSGDKFIIYEVNETLYRHTYSMEDGQPVLDAGEPTEVIRVTEYRTAEGAFVGNAGGTTTEDTKVTKTELVAALITNGQFAEEDREWLEGLEEAKLTKMQPVANDNKPGTEAAEEEEEASSAVDSLADELGVEPEQIKNALQGVVNGNTTTRASLVAKIVANAAAYTAEDLATVPMPLLNKLAKSTAPAPVANYAGAGGYMPQPAGQLVANEEGDEALELTPMDFSTSEAS